LTLVTSPGDGFTGAFGMGIVQSDAFAAGALPDPIGDMGWPGWMVHQIFSLHGPVVSGTDLAQTTLRFEIDSKAKRIMKASETFFGVYETTEIGTAAMTCFANTRVLAILS